MKLNIIFTLILIVLQIEWLDAQPKIQLSIGIAYAEQNPSTTAQFTPTDSAVFSRGQTTISASALALTPLNDHVMLRYGFNFRGNPFSSELRFDINNNGNSESIVVIYDHRILEIQLPVDVVYSSKKWFYTFAGLVPVFRLDLQSDKSRYYKGVSTGISDQDLKVQIESLSSQINPFGLNIRGGLGFKFKAVGLEFAYDHTLTNALKKEFEFNGQARSTKLVYGTFIARLTFHFKTEPGKFLVWDKE